MKIVQSIIAVLLLNLLGARSNASINEKEAAKDSIIITFGDKSRMIIYGENRKEIDKIMQYDLNALLKDLKVRLDTTASDTTYLREEVSGKNYLKDKSGDENYVRIGLRGVHVKDGDTEVTIDRKHVEVRDGDRKDSTNSEYRRTGKRFYGSSPGSSPRKGFNIAVGLNNYGKNETTPGYNKVDYDLRSFGSRFVSLGYVVSAKIARGKNAGFHLDFGADFSWFNLMFDGNNTVSKTSDRVEFPVLKDMDGKEIQLSKSKLVVPNVNLSFMPTLSFRKSFISYISAGVYGGYRIGSYTKTRKEGSKDKDHVRMNYYLTDYRYGLAAELGIRNFPDLFVNYDMNTLFTENHGPKVNMLTFGIRLF
jgi:hypothetical protein